MFVDDLLLFGQTTITQMECTLQVLQTFCNLFGKKTSNEKTIILFLKNVKRNINDELIQMYGFYETINLGKHLGVPLIGYTSRMMDFQYIINKI